MSTTNPAILAKKLKPAPKRLDSVPTTSVVVSKKGNVIAKAIGYNPQQALALAEAQKEKTIRLVDKARMLQAKREALMIQLQAVDEQEAAKLVAHQLRAENKLIREGIRETRAKYKVQRDNSIESQQGVDPYKVWAARPYIASQVGKEGTTETTAEVVEEGTDAVREAMQIEVGD